MNRSQLNGFRATTGLGQGSVRNANTRSNDKMAGYNSFPKDQVPTFENPGMQQSPMQPQGGGFGGGGFVPSEYGGMFNGQKPMQMGGFQQQPPPDAGGGGNMPSVGSAVMPQFSRPNGMLPQSGYNRFANRFAAAGGNVAAPPSWAPQNPMLAQRRPRPQPGPAAPPPAWKPEDGSIGLPPPNGF